MVQMKCKECETVFDGSQTACPNCGCPTSECVSAGEAEPSQSKTDSERIVLDAFSSKSDDYLKKMYVVWQIGLEASYDLFCIVKKFFIWATTIIGLSIIPIIDVTVALAVVPFIFVGGLIVGCLFIYELFKIFKNMFNRLISEGIINKNRIN